MVIQGVIRCSNGSAMARVAQQNLSKLGQLVIPARRTKRREEPFGGQTPHTEASDAVEASMLSSTSDGCSTCIDDSGRRGVLGVLATFILLRSGVFHEPKKSCILTKLGYVSL